VFSLLHALGDSEEVVSEALRLLLEPDMSEALWLRIRTMGLGVVPGHPLFVSNQQLDQLRKTFVGTSRISSGRETGACVEGGARTVRHRMANERRCDERRTVKLPWVGRERRTSRRRRGDP
jgi:hypothetical protein